MCLTEITYLKQELYIFSAENQILEILTKLSRN